MAWYTDRRWMYEMTNSDGFANRVYFDNVDFFLDFAFSNEAVVDTRVTMNGETIRDIKCPCYKCQNVSYRDRNTVQRHLYKEGFMLHYTTWHEHGESSTMEVDDNDDGYKQMVLDNMYSCGYTSNTLEGHVPNPEAKRFYDMLEAVDEPLWEGKKATCSTKLKAATNFLTWKSLFNVSTAAYNYNISMVNALMPEENKLPKSFYDTKKSLENLSLPKERIDVCKNHCMIFYGHDKALTHCKHCKESRYKSDNNKVPNLVMTYMPIGPRLKRLYMSIKTAKEMTWHHDHKTKEGSMAHPSDGMAWKHFDKENPGFAKEIRNVRLGLCTDGFNPNNSNSSPYSLWPVFLTIYNLPPWMSMKDSYIKLCLMIPGRKSPTQNIDVFLRPLIDELKELYEDGIEVYDAYRKENFIMRVILLWTVSDFPAYAMLSGWSTHGNLACPHCMGDTQAFRLKAGGKSSWFDCHRRFLPELHPFRTDTNGFRKSSSSLLGPPPKLTGWQILDQVFDIPVVYEGIKHNPKCKHPEFGKTHNWTIMDTRYTKDNVKARKDVEQYCNRPSLHISSGNKNKVMKPKATYTLTKQEMVDFTTLKVMIVMSSCNDCCLFVLRGMLPQQIWEPITELCTFFRVICSRVLYIEDLKKLQKSIVVTICKLEKIFPPGFFDSMEHLVIHLADEAILGGPVQFRWMYPYERKLGHIKRTVRNKGRVEGSIIESYLVDELSNYCSLYLEPTVPPTSLFDKSGKDIVLTDEDRHKAHTYIVLNCQELHESVWLFDDEMRDSFPSCDEATLDRMKEEKFATWLQMHVMNDPNKEHLRGIAQGPLTYVKSHKGYLVNGYKFHTRTAYDGRVTQNSGVCVKGASYNEHENDYYGLLDEIFEVEYHGTIGPCVVVLFKCTWFDPVSGVRVDPKTHMVDVKPTSIGCVNDPFILASQAQQVYYTSYPSKAKRLRGWLAVVKTTPRGVYELAEDVSVVDDDDDDDNNVDGEHFFQENERVECTITEDVLPISFVQGTIEEVDDDINDNNDEEVESESELEGMDDDNDEDVEFEATTSDDGDFH
ncbi:hypothetical protein SSX86_019394 [Deinandra increscens subsp. villosa]|uniref:Transposase n=1 Tax=Deinandra increscens subsp. villosa TaxID=3103831 RepID=A0AAP0CX41_9ASTR